MGTSPAEHDAPARTAPHMVIHRAAVLEDPSLSHGAVRLYVLLEARSDRDGAVSIFLRDLAPKMDVTEHTIGQLARELRERGYISTRQQGTGRPLKFTLLSIVAAGMTMLASQLATPTNNSNALQLSLISRTVGGGDSDYRNSAR